MRVAILSLVCLIAGAAVGTLLARQEFSREILPVEVLPAGSASSEGMGEKLGPRLTIISPERHDFGVMDQNAKGTHTFEIKNDGDAPLTVNQDNTSCKCTVAGLSRDKLGPGETARITLEWTAKDAYLPYEQYAEYRTNDIRRPKFRLVVYGEVRATLRAEPREAVFNRVSSHEPARATVKLYGVGAKQLEILSHKFTHAKSAPYFSLQVTPLDPADFPAGSAYHCGVELQVNLRPGLPLGQLQQLIEITTNLNPEAKFTIPVYGSIVSDISLVGPKTTAETMMVDLGSFKSTQGAKTTVFLVVKGPHRDQTSLRVAAVNPATELSVTLGEPIRDNPQIVSYPVTLQVPAGALPVNRLSTGSRVAVRFETTHPQVKELTIFARYAVVD